MPNCPATRSPLDYEKMVSLELWSVRHLEGKFLSVEDLLVRTEVGNCAGQISILDLNDICFAENFDYDQNKVERFVGLVNRNFGFLIGLIYRDYFDELFQKINDAVMSGILENCSKAEGELKVRPIELLKWMKSKPQYYVPAGLIEALEAKEYEIAEYLLRAFRQAFIYRFLLIKAYTYKRRHMLDFVAQNRDWNEILISGPDLFGTASKYLPPEPNTNKGKQRHLKEKIQKIAKKVLNKEPETTFSKFYKMGEVIQARKESGAKITESTVGDWFRQVRKDLGIKLYPGRPQGSKK